jgi:AcrR family transcriptional regulator
MDSAVAAGRPSLGRSARRFSYGVGMRVFSDRRLLRQIRAEIVRNSMQPEEIAALENVTAEVLVALLDERLAGDGDSGAQLQRFAAAHTGFSVAAWRTTRRHSSKLHLLDADGVALCGTLPGAARTAVHAGPCLTCVAHADAWIAADAPAVRAAVVASPPDGRPGGGGPSAPLHLLGACARGW